MPTGDAEIQTGREYQPDSRQADIVSPDRTQVQITARTWHGPLPPPDDFRGYEAVLPGAAERIMALAERQAGHRHRIELTESAAQQRRSSLGLLAGFVVAMTALGLGGFLIYLGHEWAGGVVVGIDLVGLVAVFVYGSRTRQTNTNRMRPRPPA